MALVCPSCDQVPSADAKAGSACSACGSRLVIVGTRDPLIGTVLDGRFEILERLGSGAMGVVYKAKQLSIGRDVALKVMNTMDDAIAVKRFFREAKIASSLAHPNTVQLIEFGQHSDGRVYIAMELVRGQTLLDELNQGAMASRRICRIGTQLCDALEAAHKLGIVHRDLKPENVMIADDGSDHIKILDFGIARILGDSRDRLTGVGLAAGTPNYMAPEVLGAAAEPAPAQDMYALGVILAELSLGHSLWHGTTLEALFVAKLDNAAFEEVPPRLRPLVKKLVDQTPEARPTAPETRRLLRELDRVATDPVGIAPTAASMPALAKLDVVALDRHGKTDVEMPAETGGPPPLELEPLPSKAPTATLDPFAPTDYAGPAPALEIEIKTKPAAAGLDILTPAALAKEPLLDVERDWQRERANKQASARSGKPTPARSSLATPRKPNMPIVPILVIVGLAAGGFYLLTRPSGSKAPAPASPTTPAPTTTATPRPPRPEPKPEPEWVTPPENTPPKTGVTIRIVGAPGTPITIDGANAGATPVSLSRKASKRAVVIGVNGMSIRVIPDHDQTIDVTNPP